MNINIDIHTLAIVLSLTNVLQVIALFAQYRLDKTRLGLGWWVLGSLAGALGFAFTYLRDNPALGPFAIVANNALFVSGLTMYYVGVLRFLGQHDRRNRLIVFCAVITLIAAYFTYINNDLAIRRVNISVAVAAMSFLIARAFIAHRNRSIATSANFLIIVFLAHGAFFSVLALTPLAGEVEGIFVASLAQTATYLFLLIFGMLWTFGFILLVNQRLNAENCQDKENLELIFNTSPDAVVITRLTDGSFVGINNGFTALSGYTRAEVIGTSSLKVNIWENPADRQKVVTVLNEKGFCENQEFVFQRKDGSSLNGLMSAKIIDLQGVPHIISVTRDITERKRAEEALRKSEELYRSLFENMLNGFAYCRMIFEDGKPQDFSYLVVNNAFEELTGLKQVAGRRVTEVIPGIRETDSQLFEIYGRVAMTGKSERFEMFVDALQMWFWISVYSPAHEYFVAVFDVITERKRADAALRESEAKLRKAQQFAHIGSWTWNIKTNQLDWSDEMFRIFGIEKETFTGSLEAVIAQAIHPDDRLAVELSNLSVINDKKPIPVEYRLVWPDRSVHIVWAEAGELLLDEAGNPSFLSGTVQEITERKRAEEALRESEERYRELVENANDIVYTLDPAGNFTSINRAAERITGYNHQEALSLNLAQVMSPDDFALARQKLQDNATNKQPTTFPLEIIAKDGHKVSLELSTRLIYHEGRLVGSQGIARDITERNRLQAELRRQATTDELTGIINRRRFLEIAHSEIKRAFRLKHPLAIGLLDIDFLKHINDTYGHAAGDQALVAFTNICQENIRDIDVLARFGGDEFALLLPEANCDQAYQAVERIHLALAKLPIDLGGKPVLLEISAGIVCSTSEHESLETFLGRADLALYRAKESGRNRVVVWDGSVFWSDKVLYETK